MSRIKSVSARLVRIPLEKPRGDAIQKFSVLELPFVEIVDEAGVRGRGFSYTIGQGGTAIMALLETELLPKLEALDSSRIRYIHEFLFKSIHALTPGVIASDALAAIDVALWDLAACRYRVPLYRLLGGAKSEVDVYNTDVGWIDRPIDEMVERCRAAVSNGFRAVKLKVGKEEANEDERRVAKVREALGGEIKIMIDANQSWTVDEAVRRMARLERYDLIWIEEPLLATDLAGFARLGAQTRTARAGGESLYSPADFYACIRAGALDILQPDIARIGGITPAMQVCDMAAAANLKVAPHVSPELSLVVAAAVPNSMYVEYIPQMEPVLSQRLRVVEGRARPSEAVGLGIPFDDDALERYEVKHGDRGRLFSAA